MTNLITAGGDASISISWEAIDPETFRIARYPNGNQVVQGGYRFQCGPDHGLIWRPLPVVDVDENGYELQK